MSDDIASLGIRVDATQADQAAKSLDNLTAAGARTEAQMGGAAAAQKALTDAAKAGQTVTSQMIRDVGGLEQAQKLLAASLGETAAATVAHTGAATAAQSATASLGTAAVAASNGLNMTSFATAGVTRELVVLGREVASGNWSRFPGSVTLLAQRMGLLGLIFDPVVLGIIATGAAFVAAGASAVQYTNEMNTLGAIAEGVGAKVGLTTQGIADAASAGAKAADISTGAALKQAQAYATTGQIGGQVIGGLIGITEDFAALTGEKTPQAMKELASAFADPAKGAVDLNDKFGFLNATQLQSIETMAKSGDALGAQRALFAALDPVMTNTEEHLRLQHDLWHNLATTIGEAWTNLGKFLSGGAPSTEVLQRAVSNIQATLASGAGGPQTAQLQDQLKQYQAQLDAISNSAKNAKTAVSNMAINKGQGVVNQYDLTGTQGLLTLQEQLATVEKALTAARTGDTAAVAGLTTTQDALTRAIASYVAPAQKAHDIATAQLQVASARTPAEKAAAAAVLTRAKAEGEVATAATVNQKAQDAATEATAKADKAGASHAATLARETAALNAQIAGLLAVAAAYRQSDAAALIEEATTKATSAAIKDRGDIAVRVAQQIALAIAQQVDAGAKAISALNANTAAQNAANDAVAAGILSEADAQRMMQDRLKLQPLLTAQQAAQIELDAEEAKGKSASSVAIATYTKALAAAKQALNDYVVSLQNANAAADRAAALNSLIQTGNQMGQTGAQASTIGASPVAQATSLASVQASQQFQGKFDPVSQAAKDRIVEAAEAVANLKAAQDAYNISLTHTSDMLSLMNDRAQTLGTALGDAFGTAGQALGGLLTALTNYAAQEAAIRTKEQQDILKLQVSDSATADEKMKSAKAIADVQTSADASVANAAVQHDAAVLQSFKSLFSTKSGAYKVLTDIQEVYYAEQFALQAKALIVDTVTTVKMIATSGIRSAAYGAEAFAKTLASLPFPFNLAAGAAVVAALAAVGVKLIGGGGGGGAVDANLAADTQKSVGTGTVLGSSSAQSDSITQSIQAAAKDQNALLNVNNQMLSALQAIESNIGNLTSQIAQQLGTTSGLFDTSGLGLGTTSGHPALGYLLGGIGGLLLKSTTTKTLLDQGISFTPQQLSQLLSTVQDQTYQTIETKKSTSFLGITLASSDKTNTLSGQVTDQLNQQIQLVVGSLRDGIVSAASVLGIDGAKATLDAFNVNLGKLSFQGLDAAGIQSELNAAFSALGDQMAQDIAPFIAHFQQAGEGAMDTLTRLANEVEVTSQAFEQLGIVFTETGVNGLDARDKLVQLAGGLDSFTSAANAYVQDILTPAQQLAPITKAVNDALAKLGLSAVTTDAQFASVVSGLDLTTAGGQQLYTQLLNLAPAFAKVADAATQLASQRQDLEITYLQATGDALGATNLQRQKELAALDASLQPLQRAVYAAQDLATANDNLTQAQQTLAQLYQQSAQQAAQDVQTATQDLTSAYQAQSTALQATISQVSGFITSLTQFRASLGLGSGSGLSLQQQYASARSQFQSTAGAASGGDATAIGNLQNVAQAFLSASQAVAPTAQAYSRDVAAVRAAVDATTAGAQAKVDVAQQQLDALNAQVSGLITINQSVLSIPVAIANLQQALVAQAAANALVPSTSLQQQIAAAQSAVSSATQAQASAQSNLATANQSVQSSAPPVSVGLTLLDASGNPLTYAAGVPSSASYYSASQQSSKRAAALAGSYDSDSAFWGRFFNNNTDLQGRYASLVASGATHGPLSTQNTNGEANWQWVRDLYKGGNFADRALFATGAAFTGQGVYQRPTSFDIGTMGEAGPEGVLPLTNVGGRLGVYAQNDNSSAIEIRALRDQVARLETALIAIASSSSRTAADVQRLRLRNDRLTKDGSTMQVTITNTSDDPVPTVAA